MRSATKIITAKQQTKDKLGIYILKDRPHYITALSFLICVQCVHNGGHVFSERKLTFTFAICYRPSVCLSSVCRLSSVTFVRPTQAVQIFGNISTALGTLAIH